MGYPSKQLHKMWIRNETKHGIPTELPKLPSSCLKEDLLSVTPS